MNYAGQFVIGGGVLIFPVIHQLLRVSLRSVKLLVERSGKNALVTGDKIKANVTTELYIKVQPIAEDVMAAARLAGAHEFILELPDGYDTMIGERSSTLSGGQRQRIAIARALVTNPRILIFDEATSALDYESEKIIQDNMRQIVKGRTVFIIAHRLMAVRVADRILTIERGRIAEDGTHEDLLSSGGRYAALYAMQS